MILAIYRLGSWIPAPGVDSETIEDFFSGEGGTILGLLNLFSGGALSQFSLFALGIMPYVTASIIVQLMTVVIPRLGELQREGEAGYAKITQYTRYLTVALAAAQATATRSVPQPGRARRRLRRARTHHRVADRRHRPPHVDGRAHHEARHRQRHLDPHLRVDPHRLADRHRRVVERWPMRSFLPADRGRHHRGSRVRAGGAAPDPIQYAKRMVGRKMTAGGSTYLPLRVNMAGVIPIIFAAAILAFPPTMAQYFPATRDFVNEYFQPGDWIYLVIEGFMIVVFTYFYTAVQFNPVDQADNLRKYGGYIPGIRPGPPTAMYLDRVLSRLTLPGSLFLALVAVLPSLFIAYGGFSQASAGALGGTSVLIAVGVALDTMRQMSRR